MSYGCLHASAPLADLFSSRRSSLPGREGSFNLLVALGAQKFGYCFTEKGRHGGGVIAVVSVFVQVVQDLSELLFRNGDRDSFEVSFHGSNMTSLELAIDSSVSRVDRSRKEICHVFARDSSAGVLRAARRERSERFLRFGCIANNNKIVRKSEK